MSEEKTQQVVETPFSSRLATRMADLFLNSIDLIEQKVAQGDAEIALGYVEAFHLYHVFDEETNEKNSFENQVSELLKPQAELDQFEYSSQFLQELNVLSKKIELHYDE